MVQLTLQSVILLLFVSILSGCISWQDIASTDAPKQFMLQANSASSMDCDNRSATTIEINPIQVLPQFDQLSFVYRLQDRQYALDYYHQFFLAPDKQLHQLTEQALDDYCWRIVQPGVNYTQRPQYQLSAQIIKFYADYHEDKPVTVFAVHYYLIDVAKQKVVFDKLYKDTATIKDANVQALLQAWDQNIKTVLSHLGHDLQQYQS